MPRCLRSGYFRVVTGTIQVHKLSSQQRCRFKSATLVVFLFNSFLSQPLILYGFDCCLVAGWYWMLFLKMALDLCVVEVSLSQSFRTARVAWDYKMTCRNHKDHPRLWGDQMKERRMGWFMITFWWFELWGVARILLLCWVWPVFFFFCRVCRKKSPPLPRWGNWALQVFSFFVC